MSKAPTVIIDPTVLGDRQPRDRDSIAKKLEETQNTKNKFKLPQQKILDNKEAATVNFMEPGDFITRLRKMSDKIIVEQGGYANCVRICTPCVDDDTDSPTFGQLVKQPIGCGFPVDAPLAEFDYAINDKWGVPVRTVRGWRTVLLRLIHMGIVTYAQVKAEFGEPEGQRSVLWMEQMQARRA